MTSEPDKWEYKERENITYEVIATGRTGYIDARVVYRFWPVGDGDWKLQVIDSDSAPVEPILIPSRVIDKIINITVKRELKDER